MSEPPTALTPEEQEVYGRWLNNGASITVREAVRAIIRRLDARLSDAMAVVTEWGNVDKTTAMAQRDALARALVQADAALLELERAHHGLVGCDPTCEELIHPAVVAARQRQGTEGRG